MLSTESLGILCKEVKQSPNKRVTRLSQIGVRIFNFKAPNFNCTLILLSQRQANGYILEIPLDIFHGKIKIAAIEKLMDAHQGFMKLFSILVDRKFIFVFW